MQVEEALFGRRSIRAYADEPIDEAAIRRVIEAAIQAPTAMNVQPWAFAVVRGRPALDRLSRDAKAHLLAITPAEHVDFRAHLGDPAFDIFFGAPALIVVSARAQGPYIVEDCSAAAQNLMLAAYSEGLGTCWIGLAKDYLNTAGGRAAIGAPAEWVAIAPIIVGRPSAVAAPVGRSPAEIRGLE